MQWLTQRAQPEVEGPNPIQLPARDHRSDAFLITEDDRHAYGETFEGRSPFSENKVITAEELLWSSTEIARAESDNLDRNAMARARVADGWYLRLFGCVVAKN